MLILSQIIILTASLISINALLACNHASINFFYMLRVTINNALKKNCLHNTRHGNSVNTENRHVMFFYCYKYSPNNQNNPRPDTWKCRLYATCIFYIYFNVHLTHFLCSNRYFHPFFLFFNTEMLTIYVKSVRLFSNLPAWVFWKLTIYSHSFYPQCT